MSEERPSSSLKELGEKLKAARGHRAASGSEGDGGAADQKGGLGFAFRIGIELVSAIGIGVAIGLLLDSWLETGPWFMVAFFVLGSVAGFLNVYRAARGLGYAVGYEAEKEAKPEEKKERDAATREAAERDKGSK